MSPSGRRMPRRVATVLAALLVTTLATGGASAVDDDPDPDPCARRTPPPACTVGNPTGRLDAVTRGPGGLSVSGTATDPDAPGPVRVDIDVNGIYVGSLTGTGAAGAFTGTVPARAGSQVCAWAVNRGQGTDTSLGCRSLIVGVDPIGNVDEVIVTEAGLRVRGWALDPDAADPVTVHLQVDGTVRTQLVADVERPDVAAANPGYGNRHGFEVTLTGPQRHTSVCAVAVNTGAGSDAPAGCGRDPRPVSVLTLNVRGTHETWEHPGALGQSVFVPWRERYRRLAGWMADTATLPDLIALQEVPTRKWWIWPSSHVDPYDYEALFLIIDAIRERTGAHYRIAYNSADYVGEAAGLQPLYQGRALIYNADRLRNTTLLVNFPAVAHDDQSTVGVHMRTSFPCAITPPESRPQCDLVDSTAGADHEGRHWTSSYTDPTTGAWYRGAQAAVFELRATPGKHVLLANVHVAQRCPLDPKTPPCLAKERAEMLALRALVDQVSATWAPQVKLVPPIVVGDFNGAADMPTTAFDGTYEPTLPDFDQAGGDYVDFVLVGNRTAHPATYRPTAESVAYPTRVPFFGLPEAPYCGTPSTALGDHCAVYTQLLPYPSTTPPPSPVDTATPPPPPGPHGPIDNVCDRKPWLVGC